MVVSYASGSALEPIRRSRSSILLAGVILLVTFVLGCAYSNGRPLWGDEILTYYTINQPTIAQLVRFQSTTPIVLEPPGFEILAHIIGRPFGYSLFSLRLPSILCFLLAQVFLFGVVRRVAGDRAALFAMAAMPSLHLFMYAAQVRPYAFLMAMSMGAIFCWQRASRDALHRSLCLCGLALTLALAVTCQFFGILAALPIFVGEGLRLLRKQVDRAVWIAILLGTGAVFLDVPIWRAALPYKEHYSRDPDLGWRRIPQTYLDLIFFFQQTYDYGSPRRRIGHMVFLAIIIFLCCFLSYRNMRATPSRKDLTPEWAALVAFALLPCVAVAIGYWVSLHYANRYSVESILGVAALFAISLGAFLERLKRPWYAVAFVLWLFFPLESYTRHLPRIYAEKKQMLASAQASPALLAEIRANPAELIFASADACLDDVLYAQPEVLERFRCLYSRDREIKYSHHQVVFLSLDAMMRNTSFPLRISSYDEFANGMPHMLVYTPLAWEEWIPASLAADHAKLEAVGKGLTGTIYRVSFPAKPLGVYHAPEEDFPRGGRIPRAF